MTQLRFEWDDRKASANVAKHHVSFEEARSVFLDEDALLIPDVAHSHEDERFILLGMSLELRALVVIHCYREAAEVIRIISARRANQPEREQYEAGRRA